VEASSDDAVEDPEVVQEVVAEVVLEDKKE